MIYLHSLFSWVQQLPGKQKAGLTLTAALILVFTLGLSWWALSPSYAVLFTQLDEQDANHIVTELENSNTPYQLRHEGRDILIDKNIVAKTRLKMMSSGLNLSGQVGFELFDKNDFGMTDFSQKINYQRALQGELERTVVSLEEVKQVRIHLVIPEQRLFTQETNPPKAAVTLHLKAPLTNKQVRSIQQLISASVPHLSIKNVVVVDQSGNTLSTSEDDNNLSHLTTKKTLEHYLTNKVHHMLAKVFNENDVLVKIDVLLNYDELQRELIKPQADGVITHEKKTEHAIQDKSAKDKTKKDITLEKSYQLGSKKESFKRASGTIEHLSISVVLPKNTPHETLEQVQRLVKNTVGFDEQRGDTISVEALITAQSPTERSELLPLTPCVRSPPKLNPMLLAFCLAFLLCVSIPTTLFLRQKRMKKRQVLLSELTQWLDHHG